MNLKSIKWRLQLWYGLILVAVLTGFGVTAYQLERNRVFRQVDEELHRRFAALTGALHPRPPHGRRPFAGPPGEPPDDLPPLQNPAPRELALPPFVANLFDTNQPNDFYFIICSPGGGEIAGGGRRPVNAVSHPVESPIGANRVSESPDRPAAKPPRIVSENEFREIIDQTPGGETIVVGCSVAPELHELNLAALKLTAMGGWILLVGLAGGGWLVARALRPIAAISAAAAKISAGDLSQRISTAETESELGRLAAVLNSTFARLEGAFKQQRQFAADAAHELRTPVSVILTQTQTALSRERDAAAYRQTVEACQRAAQRMRRLIGSLLELARFDAGQEVLARLKFDLGRTVAEGAETVRALAEEKHVRIDLAAKPVEITGDPERLAQVVINLLTNAIQFNRPEGRVHVKLEAEGGLAVLQIADTGPGIAAADLPRLFERFYRADQSRTGSGNSGLGLSICKAIVEAHGGTVEATSQAGSGATFTVRLPI